MSSKPCCIVCGSQFGDRDHATHISDGVFRPGIPSFLPNKTIGYVCDTCIERILKPLESSEAKALLASPSPYKGVGKNLVPVGVSPFKSRGLRKNIVALCLIGLAAVLTVSA